MNKNFWLFTIVCSFCKCCNDSSFLEWRISITNLSIPCVVLRIPLMVRRLKNAKFNDDLPLSMGYHTYSWSLVDCIFISSYAPLALLQIVEL